MQSLHQLHIVAIQDMILARTNLLVNIVNLAMRGELSHLSDAVDIGDSYILKKNHFRDLKDPLIKELLQICDDLDSKIPELMDIYNIDVTEVDFDV